MNKIKRYFLPKKDGDSLLINISPNLVYITIKPTEDVELDTWSRVDYDGRKEIVRSIFSIRLGTVGL